MIVMKFGGSSVADAARIEHVAGLALRSQKKEPVVIVLSALYKITDLLVDSAKASLNKNDALVEKALSDYTSIHKNTVRDLRLDKSQEAKLLKILDQKSEELKKALKKIASSNKIKPKELDAVLSLGERLSVHLLSAAINKLGGKSQAVEAQTLIVTTSDFGSAKPLLSQSQKKIKAGVSGLLKQNIIPVITGFIGATRKGEITTLGRGGSDYTATIVANCLDADEICIWKDVDGAMTADPKIIENAKTIPVLSYDEAAEISYFGAKVLHPLTMVPAALKKIPIRIKNTFKPDFAGTQILEKTSNSSNYTKAITSITSLSLITVQGKGMLGIPGIAAKLFSAIAGKKINVLFISQASSEYNITFIVKKDQSLKAVSALKNAFKNEILNKSIDTIHKEDDVAIIAVIGEGMRGKPAVAGKIFSALGDAGIATRAIAEGSSERNLSLVVAESDVTKAVKNIHNRLILTQ